MSRSNDEPSWKPTATIEFLRFRAKMIARVREFFHSRNYLEVDTPILSSDVCVDAHIDPVVVPGKAGLQYLQTSPEFSMKRLLTAGSGSIFQVAHAFREGEIGDRHNREFTLLEWYKLGADHHALMDEVEDLLVAVAEMGRADRVTYRQAFASSYGIDPELASVEWMRSQSAQRGLMDPTHDRDDLLNFLWADGVEPTLASTRPVFIYHYPTGQSALASVRMEDGFPAARRFELYWNGVEICNGWEEETDAEEILRRFHEQNRRRSRSGKELLPTDSFLLDAMRSGLPSCAGVALGLDRLFMLLAGCTRLSEAISFPSDRS